MTVNQATQLVEEGAAALQLVERTPRSAAADREHYDVIVIGGGQAGLSVGFHLKRAGVRFVILDANERIGDSWRKRWDSLRLFTPAKLDSLDGMPFPSRRNYFPTKNEMADYLESYARRFRLPVRTRVRVERLFKRGARFVAAAGTREFEADQVVVAMAKYQQPQLPAFAASLSREITQLHSLDYRNLHQLRPGGVVLVGTANSGADIALEAVRGGHETWISGRDVGEMPFRPEQFLGRNFFAPFVLGFVFHHVLTVETPIGRKVRAGAVARAVPRIRVKRRDLTAARVQFVPRIVGARDGLPLLEDGRTLPVTNVVWCTGFQPGFDWIDLPVFGGEHGEPKHRSGVAEDAPGLYFVGLPFLYSMSSSMIHGVGRDAARIVEAISLQRRAGSAVAAARV
jgi:putative flavoprotein involved in K+ transport